MSTAKRIGARMQITRSSAGFTQEEEALRLGITRAALSHYENGRREPNLEMLVAFADLHNVSIDYLLGREEVTMSQPVVNELMTNEPTTEECFNDSCGALIQAGDTAFKVGQDICCSMSCADKVRREIKIERFII